MNKLTMQWLGCRIPCHTVFVGCFSMLFAVGSMASAQEQEPTASAARMLCVRGVLLPVAETSSQRLQRERSRGMNTVVLALDDPSPAARTQIAQAAERIRSAKLKLAYWIEVARCPALADQHPEWMASLQGHDQWRRFFPQVRPAEPDEVTKVYPWVPVLYEESFAAQLERIRSLVTDQPPAVALYLNDLQGAPSACGCGNTLCRWTTDYGPIRTATPLDDSAASSFVAKVSELVPESKVIPIWVTECEEHDGAADGMCAGVGCFRGICWKAYTRQLMPVANGSTQIGVLLPTVDFQRKDTVYGSSAGWVTKALQTFQTMPPQNQGEAIVANRLIAVVQGWGTDEEFVAAQIQAAKDAAVHQYVVAYDRIEQGWEPRVFKQSELAGPDGDANK